MATAKEKKNNSIGFWVVGVIAVALLIGIVFLLNNQSSNASTEQLSRIEETDPEALIKKHVEAIYSDVFSSPEANCESRHLTPEFYNLYVQARDKSSDGTEKWKRMIWLKGEDWREMSVKITNVDLTFFPTNKASARVDLIDNNGKRINDVTLYLEDVKGNCRIREISYNFGRYEVKKTLERYVNQANTTEGESKDDDSFDYDDFVIN